MLNGAAANDVAVLVVPSGVVVEAPIHILYLSTGEGNRVAVFRSPYINKVQSVAASCPFFLGQAAHPCRRLLPPPPGASGNDPLHRDASAPRVLVHAGSHSVVEVVEEYGAAEPGGGGNYFSCGITEILLEEHAEVREEGTHIFHTCVAPIVWCELPVCST